MPGYGVLTVWSRTKAGRALVVTVRQVDAWDWLILGARDMDPDETADYERWEAQRD